MAQNNIIVFANDGFKDKKICFTETDYLCMKKKVFINLEQKTLVGEEMDERKIDYGDCSVFYAMFIALKVEFRLTPNEYGILKEKKDIWELFWCNWQINCWTVNKILIY